MAGSRRRESVSFGRPPTLGTWHGVGLKSCLHRRLTRLHQAVAKLSTLRLLGTGYAACFLSLSFSDSVHMSTVQQ